MNVGSLAEFTSTVVYSSQGHIVVQVVVMTVDIKTGFRSKTNVLTYIFRLSYFCFLLLFFFICEKCFCV